MLAFAIFSVDDHSLVSHPSLYLNVYGLSNDTSYWNIIEKTAGWDALTAFLENITSWDYLEISGLKDIFHWKVHSDIFFMSLFRWNSDRLTSFTAE